MIENGIKQGDESVQVTYYHHGPKAHLEMLKHVFGSQKKLSTHHFYEEHGPSNGFTRFELPEKNAPMLHANWAFVMPFMKINDMEKAKPVMDEARALTQVNEPYCVFYGFTHDPEANTVFCREAYSTGCDGLLKHLTVVQPALNQMVGDNLPLNPTSLEIWAFKDDLANFKDSLGKDPVNFEFNEIKDGYVRKGLFC